MERDRQRKRVLVVDDDAVLLDSLRDILTLTGSEVVACATFADARQVLRTEHFDVMVLDVRLGEFNGLQLAHIGRAQNPDATIIVFSGYSDAVLEAEAARIGAIFATKPLYADHLLQLISGADATKGPLA